jgi:hypothetical protein
MRPRIVATCLINLSIMLGASGCYAVSPAPLHSGDAHVLGNARRTFHRELLDVAITARRAMTELGYTDIHEQSEVGNSRIAAVTRDGQPAELELRWESGTLESTPLPLRHVITRATLKVGSRGDREASDLLLNAIATQLRTSDRAKE